MYLFSSLAQFSLIASFCVFLQKIRGSSGNFFMFIYIYKIEIRNSETYLPEVSVSSTMALEELSLLGPSLVMGRLDLLKVKHNSRFITKKSHLISCQVLFLLQLIFLGV